MNMNKEQNGMGVMGVALLTLSSILTVPPSLAAPLVLSNVPLFQTTPQKGNVLLIMDNSNSMDENAAGAAVGSDQPTSKSEIARSVAKNIITTYMGQINLGLMAYQQTGVASYFLHNSPYDVSYNPANYDATFTGARDALTKRFREPNPSSPGDFIHYNVALPFYASSNQGDGFCYSPTAKAFNNGENPLTGPWDTYRCFSSKTGTSDTLPTWGDGASEAAAGYAALFYNGQFFPTDSDLAQGITDFGKQNTWRYVGPTWFANTSPGKGYLHTPIALLDATQAAALNTKLGTSQFATNSPTGAAFPLQNAGLTPIEGTLLTAKDYFAGALTDAARGGPKSAPPNSCGKDFVVMVTDGLPSTDQNGVALTNPTTALTQAAASAAALKAAKIDTYVVGFALPYGTNPASLDTIAAAGGTGTAYSASDYASLSAALNSIFNSIKGKMGSGASVAATSTSKFANSTLYQAKFKGDDWTGALLALPVNNAGVIGAPAWDAASLLTSATGRNIITYKRSNGNGIPFVWPVNATAPTASELDLSQISALNTTPSGGTDTNGAARLAYLRGSAANEGTAAGNFRPRPVTKLGDIINSSPVFVGAPNDGYPDTIEVASYATFRNSNLTRDAMVYVGANDGMLHAFDATVGNASSGKEKFAYVPTSVFPTLSQLPSQTYSHRYYVDGTPVVGDAYFGGAWHSVLIGGLNAGGQGIYALDITNPAAVSEATASTLALWEFTDLDDADLGFTFSRPEIVKMNNNKWAVVFGNGYNNSAADGNASSTGYAVLYIAFIDGGLDGVWTAGTDYIKISTKKGSVATPNGLGGVATIDTNGDYKADYIYAGDLLGNMWKFDVTNATPSNWAVAYGNTTTPAPLFTAKDASNNAQPIMARPEIGYHPSQGYLVYFGTGKYLEATDVSSTSSQSFYGIWDDGGTVTRSDLLQQTILAATTFSGKDFRTISNNTINWCGTGSCHKGWYLDLTESGERQVTASTLQNGNISFVTITPSSTTCSAGGSSWFMQLNAITGGRPKKPVFNVNQDAFFNAADATALGANGNAGGQKLQVGIAPEVTTIKGEKKDKNLVTGSKSFTEGGITKDIEEPDTGNDGAVGRISWRELR